MHSLKLFITLILMAGTPIAFANFYSPVPPPQLCPECSFSVEGTIPFDTSVTFPVDLTEGLKFESVLNVSVGSAGMEITNASNLDCYGLTCTFEATGSITNIIISGKPGPADFSLEVTQLN